MAAPSNSMLRREKEVLRRGSGAATTGGRSQRRRELVSGGGELLEQADLIAFVSCRRLGRRQRRSSRFERSGATRCSPERAGNRRVVRARELAGDEVGYIDCTEGSRDKAIFAFLEIISRLDLAVEVEAIVAFVVCIVKWEDSERSL
ncbi:gamma-aminobutyric acid receptor subunit pi [Striga asiatica]|uniref:Gamma-aminobutyric acid receptor subunit pi n=1 Tax=Striga asiatica TaxID=4170 RepID=A0A5A7R7L1_STRAF|nr:gamma-aminobutyric acid receptor subunit pi [Striga asiatica]